MGVATSHGSEVNPVSLESNAPPRSRTSRTSDSVPPSIPIAPPTTTIIASPQEGVLLEGDLDSTVPTVFRWEHGGKDVRCLSLLVFFHCLIVFSF